MFLNRPAAGSPPGNPVAHAIIACVGQISVTHLSDPGCPWAYSASPALAVLRWRYRAQLNWRMVTIGLSEDPQQYVERGYTPTRMTVGNLGFRRYGMPFGAEPRALPLHLEGPSRLAPEPVAQVVGVPAHELERRVTGRHERPHQQGAQRPLAFLTLLVRKNVLQSGGRHGF